MLINHQHLTLAEVLKITDLAQMSHVLLRVNLVGINFVSWGRRRRRKP